MERWEKAMARCSEYRQAKAAKAETVFSKFWMVVALAFAMALTPAASFGQQGRRPVSNPQPEYPDVAKKMNLSGVVKVEVVIGADGQIKDAKVIGGHPVLIDSVERALKKWKYAPGSSETKELLEFKF
jgi:TonB family protein